MTVGLADVVAVRSDVARVTAGIDSALFETAGAVAVLEHVVAMRNMLAAVEAEFAAKIAATEQWRRAGFRSADEWLASKTGTSRPQAAGSIATGKRMQAQPNVAKAAKAGKLSAEQARLVSDAAAADPGAEQRLVEAAGRASLPELREQCQRVKAAADPDPDATHARIRAARFLRRWRDGEGGWNLSGRGVPEDGALIGAVLDELADELLTQARQAGGPLASPESYSWDALVELARCWNTRHHTPDQPACETDRGTEDGTEDATDDESDDVEPGSHGSAEVADAVEAPPGTGIRPSTGASARPARTRRPRARSYLALLRVDVAALQRGMVDGEELCDIAGIGPVPVRVARQLLGDAVLKLVITRGVDVANIVHLGRGPTVAQRCAMLWLDPRCYVEGCHRPWEEADHDIDYATTKHTILCEMVGYCGHHHDLKTYAGWALVPGTGRRPMVPPDEPRHPKNLGPPGDADTLFP